MLERHKRFCTSRLGMVVSRPNALHDDGFIPRKTKLAHKLRVRGALDKRQLIRILRYVERCFQQKRSVTCSFMKIKIMHALFLFFSNN
jgi:hypothetical protein